ncbi:MAG: hypothetical protein M5U18_16715 [Dehalococcoidia bacterium]|nr:hypothetical protein [Dehalococcoidia bacterium]
MANDQVQKYYNSLLASYDVLVDAVTRANERGFNVTKQFASDVAKGQREAIELGKSSPPNRPTSVTSTQPSSRRRPPHRAAPSPSPRPPTRMRSLPAATPASSSRSS